MVFVKMFIIIKHRLLMLSMQYRNCATFALVANWHVVQRSTLGVVVDPVKDLRVPDQAILLLQHPMVLVREIEEARWDTAGLENVEEAKTIGLGQTVVESVMNDKVRSGPIGNVVEWVPLVVAVRLPDAAVIVVADEPQFLGSPSGLGLRDTIVCNKSLELVAEVIGLDPVGHVSSVRSTGADAVLGVNPLHRGVDVVPCVDEVGVRSSAPVTLDSVGQVLSETGRASWVGCYDNIALIGPCLRVPSVRP